MGRTRSLASICLAAVILAGMLVSAGCSNSRARQDSQDLRDAVYRAGRLCEKAIALLGNPVVIANEGNQPKYNPFPQAVSKDTPLEMLSPLAVNPNVTGLLDEARGMLEKAIADCAAAAAADVDLARTQLLQIRSLQARTHGNRAAYERSAAADLMGQAQMLAKSLWAASSVNEYYRQAADMEPNELQTKLVEARTQADALRTRIDDANTQIAELQRQKDAAFKEMNGLQRKATDLRLQSEGFAVDDPKKAQELLDEVWSLQVQAHQSAQVISSLAGQISEKATQAAILAQELSVAETLAIAMQKGLVSAESFKDQAKSQGQAISKTIADNAARLTGLMQQVGQKAALAREQELAALAACPTAKDFPAVKGSGDEAAELSSRIGNAYLGAGELLVTRLAFRKSLVEFADGMKALWAQMESAGPAPEILEALPGKYMSEPDQQIEVAEDHFVSAITQFDAARQAMRDRQKKWAYQGQLAVAYIQLYQLKKDPDKRQKAMELLNEALKDQASSPFLKSLVWWRQQIAS